MVCCSWSVSFVVCLLFLVCSLLIVLCCSLSRVVCWVLSVGFVSCFCLSSIVRCVSVGYYVLFAVVCCLLRVACCVLVVDCCLLFDACHVLLCGCCWLLGLWLHGVRRVCLLVVV